jgi:peptide deformylase
LAFVAFDDPRLAGPVQAAVPGDSETTSAIAALRKALLSPEHGVLSALCLGFAVNVIGLRTGGGPVAFLNPRLVAASDFSLSQDETFVLTDIVRRQLIRPRRVVVAGQRENGEEASFTSEGAPAVQALQHLELIAGDIPLRWLSPTERLMLDPIIDPALRQAMRTLYLAVNDAAPGHRRTSHGLSTLSLPSGSASAATNTDTNTADAAPNGRLVAAASRVPALDLHLRDPILPVSSANLLLFAFAVAPARRQHALVVGTGALGAAVSLKHVFPQLVLDLALPTDPLPADPLAADPLAAGPLPLLRLRPDERLRLHGADLQVYERATGRNEVDAILIDLTAAPDETPDLATLEDDFRSLSRVTRGDGGLAAITCGQRNPRIEAALKATFVHVDCWEIEDHGLIYLAGKRPFARDMILGRICDLGLKIQSPALRQVFLARVTSLGKDGHDRDASG